MPGPYQYQNPVRSTFPFGQQQEENILRAGSNRNMPPLNESNAAQRTPGGGFLGLPGVTTPGGGMQTEEASREALWRQFGLGREPVGMMPFGGSRAGGGSVEPGKVYEVNDGPGRGTELFVPAVPGVVLPAQPLHPNDMPPQNPYASGGQFRDPTSTGPGSMPAPSVQPGTGNGAPGAAAAASYPSVFDIGLRAGERRGPGMSSAPTTYRGPEAMEESWKGLTGSQKKARRMNFKEGLAAGGIEEAISLDKQAKGAIGEFEAMKEARKQVGLPPLDRDMEKAFYNGNVQKQLAMTQQLRLINNEHLREKQGDKNQQQRTKEKQDDRLWQQQQTTEERAYEEKRRATLTKEQRAAAANWQPLSVAGRQTGYAANELGNLINMGTGEPVELTPEQIAAIRKDGGRVSIGPDGTRVSYGGEKEAKPAKVKYWDNTRGAVVELDPDDEPPPNSGLVPFGRKAKAGAAPAAAASDKLKSALDRLKK